MKFELTHPKVWEKLAEKQMPMRNKIKIYEKLGGAYRFGESGGEQVFNKMTELLKYKLNEGDESSPEETIKGLTEMTMGQLERIADYANMISQRMSEGQQLDSWMYSQITLAVDQLNSVHDAMDGDDGKREPMKEEQPGLWANIRAKKARGEKPAHGNSDAHKDAVKAGKEINKNESVRTKYPLKDGRYQFDVKDGVGYLTYGGKELSSGDYDWEDGSNSFWMSHSSWGGQKAFDSGKDVINYFKSKRITQP